LDRVTPWLQFRPAAGNQRLRLFCLPHAGGGATTYHSWTAELPAFVQLCPVLLPGRETRLSEALYTQIDPLLGALDRELRPWLDIPYAVFGHSMGALLAFAWVRILQREGASMPVWLFLSGRRAPDTPGDTNLLHALPDGEFVKELTRRYNGIPQEVSENEALMEVFLPILRDHSLLRNRRCERKLGQVARLETSYKPALCNAGTSRRPFLSPAPPAANDLRNPGRTAVSEWIMVRIALVYSRFTVCAESCRSREILFRHQEKAKFLGIPSDSNDLTPVVHAEGDRVH